jgi:uncharacterized protein (TIGR02266 family)
MDRRKENIKFEAERRLSDRRKDLRSDINMEVKCQVKSTGEFFIGYSKNISKGGLFLVAAKDLTSDTPIDLEFTLPQTSLPMHLNGRVKWIQNDSNYYNNSTPNGFGIKFDWKYIE